MPGFYPPACHFSQEPVAGSAQTRDCSRHHLATVEASLPGLNADDSGACETLERNLFHRSEPRPVCDTWVMNEPSIANVDAVVHAERSRCDEV
jgi:hypothetical protein